VEARQNLFPIKRNVFLDVPAPSVLQLILVPADYETTFLQIPQISKTISGNFWGITGEFLGNEQPRPHNNQLKI